MSPTLHYPAFDLAQLDPAIDPEVRWLWHGYLGRGELTLLTCQWKAGKSTLVAMLLDRMKSGGRLADLPVTPGRAAVVSEEKQKDWQRRCQKFQLQGHATFFFRPFQSRKPTLEQWLRLTDDLAALHRAVPLDLVVIDTIGSLLPAHAEIDPSVLAAALAPLSQLAETGPAVFLLHHPRKMAAPAGLAARGTGQLAAGVDILMEMHWYRPGAETDRRRRLIAFSRHDATLPQQVIEFSADGTDYAAHGDFEQDEFKQRWRELFDVLEPSRVKLTRAEILEQWPAATRPPASTLWRWLARAVTLGLLRQDGGTQPSEPHRYWLPDLEKKWQSDPLAKLWQDQQDSARQLGDLFRPLRPLTPPLASRQRKRPEK